MNWLNPTYLFALLLVPLVVGLMLWAAWQRKKSASLFGSSSLVRQLAGKVSTRKRRWKGAVLSVGFLFLTVALAGPRFGTKLKEVSRDGIDLVIALDVSSSMTAEDVSPNRLSRAKFEISKLLSRMTGDRVGIVLFAGDAFVQCPLTLDYSAVRLFLDISDPSLIPTPGTDFERAIQVSLKAFETGETASPDRTRALLIVSDGENHLGDIDNLKSIAAQSGVVVFTSGVGETAGAPIPLVDRGRRVGYKTDRNGETVITRLEEDGLKLLGENGGYFRISRTSSALSDFIDAIGALQRSEFGTEIFEEYEEKYQWPLAIALLLIAGEWWISETRKRTGNEMPDPDHSLDV